MYDIILQDRFWIRPKTSNEYSIFEARSSPKKKNAIIDLNFIVCLFVKIIREKLNIQSSLSVLLSQI